MQPLLFYTTSVVLFKRKKQLPDKGTEKNILAQLRKTETFERGFSDLVQTYQERLYWHIRSIVGNHHAADEVLQNTFIKIYKGMANFRGESALYTWMHRIATNESLTFCKQQQKRATIALEDAPQVAWSAQSTTSGLEGSAITQLLQQALATLPKKQQQVFQWRYYDAMPYKEMAAQTNTSVGALKASYHHAVKKIEAYVLQHLPMG